MSARTAPCTQRPPHGARRLAAAVMSSLLAIVMVAGVLVSPVSADHSHQNADGELRFREGNDGSQSIVCKTYAPAPGFGSFWKVESLWPSHYNVTNFPGKACKNDEIRSVELYKVLRGTRIEVYDDSSCSRTKDDWAEIVLTRDSGGYKRYIPGIGTIKVAGATVDSFEDGRWGWKYRDGYKIRWHTHGSRPNLDGKISCIRVIGPSA